MKYGRAAKQKTIESIEQIRLKGVRQTSWDIWLVGIALVRKQEWRSILEQHRRLLCGTGETWSSPRLYPPASLLHGGHGGHWLIKWTDSSNLQLGTNENAQISFVQFPPIYDAIVELLASFLLKFRLISQVFGSRIPNHDARSAKFSKIEIALALNSIHTWLKHANG